MAYTTINKPTDYFNTKLYTGNGTDNHAITGVGFQPDFIWIKARSAAKSHRLQNAVSGITNHLRSDTTDAESSASGVKTADSDGFTLGTSLSWNQNSTTYASWNWLADNTSGSSNTDGSITSTVSANTTSGFSVVSWTGNGTNPSTIGHGLGVAPKMIIMKNPSSSSAGWYVYHVSNGASAYMRLNLTDAVTTSHGLFNNTAPTSTVFSVNNDVINGNGNTIIAYCFAEKKGYSKFGSYTGNGSTDGTFVYTGFKPAWVMIKRTDVTDQWYIIDNKRSSINPTNQRLFANLSDAESASSNIDILSQGFKSRSTSATNNSSGGTYIYMAFAEQPLVTTGKIPATAR